MHRTPQWVDPDGKPGTDDAGTRKFPVSYVRSRPGKDTRITVTPKFTMKGTVKGDYTIKGVATRLSGGNLTFAKQVTVEGGNVLTATITSAEKIANTIDDAELAIDWTIVHGEAVEVYGKSTNHAYVTGAVCNDEFETVLSIGCRNAGGRRPADEGELEPGATGGTRQVADAIWGEFADNSVSRVHAGEMKYGHRPAPNTTLAQLLQTGTGQCTAWTRLLVHSLAAQGVAATIINVAPDNFVFKGLSVKSMPAQGSGANDYDDVTKFELHRVVRVGAYPDRIYDPSYGGLKVGADAAGAEAQWEADNVVELYSTLTDMWEENGPNKELVFTDVQP